MLVVLAKVSCPPNLKSRSSAFWSCRCDCGNVKTFPATSLTTGNSRSCNCARSRPKSIGDHFGKLLVVELLPDKMCRCACDCGNHIIVRHDQLCNSLVNGRKSCGCGSRVRAEMTRKEAGYADFPIWVANMRARYRRSAKERGVQFLLTISQFFEITQRNCHYCNCLPVARHDDGRDFNANGIDQVTAGKGYTLSNIVACCPTCNYAKGDMTELEFLAWVKRVYNHQKEKYETAVIAA